MTRKSIRTIVIDDDEDWLSLIATRVKAHPKLELAGLFESVAEAHNVLMSGDVDLLILDVKMPDANGIDFYKRLAKPPYVIFISSYSEFAVDSYETNAVDFLTKPLTTPRFLQAIERVVLKLAEQEPEEKDELKYFFVREGNDYFKVEFDKILFFRALENYTQIYTIDSMITTLLALKTIEAQLPVHKFQRINRSQIVNLSKITAVKNSTEVVINAHELPLSRIYVNSIMKNFVKSKLLGKVE